MKKRTFLFLALFIGSLVFVSYYGGPLPYLLAKGMFVLLLCCVVYIIYVYWSIQIYQEVPEKIVVKGQTIDYQLTLANPRALPFVHVRLEYYKDTARIEKKEEQIMEMQPKQKDHYHSPLVCFYQGTYPIGVKSIELEDFLHLFTIRFNLPGETRVTVRPRVVKLEKLCFDEENQDGKFQSSDRSMTQAIAGLQVRDYIPGDSMHLIHWKNTAKTGQLMVRKTEPPESMEQCVYLDTSHVEGEWLKQYQVQDLLIESTLAIVNYYVEEGSGCSVFYPQRQMNTFAAKTRKEFQQVYDSFLDVRFSGKESRAAIMEQAQRNLNGRKHHIFLVCEYNEEWFELEKSLLEQEHMVTFILVSVESAPEEFHGIWLNPEKPDEVKKLAGNEVAE